MPPNIVQSIRRGLTRQLREALRSCKGYKVRSNDMVEGSSRATLVISAPDGVDLQLIEITGTSVKSQWLYYTTATDPSGEIEYEYADPSFILQLRKDTREAAQLYEYLTMKDG